MIRLTLRSLRADALRLLLSSLAIVLGVAFVAGAMAFVAKIGGDFTLVLPWGRLGLMLAVAVLAALLASVLPARRALSRPVVEALGAE
ncbi:hypothetical protein V6U89_16265 [Micromonospora sp. CPCC 206171]|uniref:hypothetical protein n=1 Tax=Micromonospora sp. CPCC 206171 TaxID=3122405 RepID=UPI002FF17DBE